MTASGKYPFLFVTSTLAAKMFPSTLVILNIFETNTVNCLRTVLCGGPRHRVSCDYVDLLLIEQVICPKCCRKSEAVAQESSVKMRFCRTSQMSQKTSKMEPLFRKTVSSQACSCTKKDTVAGDSAFSCEYNFCEYIFSFFTFLFQKRSVFV